MAEKRHAVSTPCLAAAVMSPTPSTSKTGNNVARIQRNVAEKQRRDKLNGYISELANIVPMVSMSSKRLDKTSILRLSAAHLRICKSSLSGKKKQKKALKWCPSFLTEEQVREILESVDGFLMVTTSNGKVLFTSRSVERYLGHQDIDLIGHSLFTFVHPDDLDTVKDEVERLFLAAAESGSVSSRCSFRCRMREKGQPRSEVVTYQSVHFVGGVTASDEDASDEKVSKSIVSHMFKAFVKVVDISPYNQLSLEEATADEYVTRHSLDGTIIFADHRLATITGHMPHEVVGLSAYAYIHSDDTSVALFAHHLMFSNDKGTGMIVYRLRTRDDRYVYLKSVGCLQFDGSTSQVDHFVCVNQHLNDSDGDLQLKYFVDRYIPHIKGNSASSLFESVKALQISSTKSSPTGKRMNGSRPENNLKRSLNLESDVTARPEAGTLDNQENENKGSSRTDSDRERFKEVNQQGFTESASLSSSIKSLNNPLPSTGDFSSSNLSSYADENHDDRLASKAQISGTNLSNKFTAYNTEYFSKTLHTSTSENVDLIYISSLDSTFSIHKEDKVQGPTKTTLPSPVVDSSYAPEKQPKDKAKQANVEENNINMTDDNRFEIASQTMTEKTMSLNRMKKNLEIQQTFEDDDDGSEMLRQIDGLAAYKYGSQIEHSNEVIERTSIYSSHHQRDLYSSPKNMATDSNSSVPMGFTINSQDSISGDVDHMTGKHSSFIDDNICLNNTHLNLSSNDPRSSSTVFRNSMWLADDGELKNGISNSSMDCDNLPTVYADASDDMKTGLPFQEDLSSLLSSTLPHGDSNSSLPSANGWNDIFSFSDYPSSLNSDVVFQNAEEQISLNNPNVKSYDLW